jgi:CubicO group peptidase (beta-lactamase class C family)
VVLDSVRSALQPALDDRRLPGYVAAVRHAGRTQLTAAGSLELGGDRPVREDSLFRIASLSKPVLGALALALIEQGVLGVEDEVARWLPELAAPRVLRNLGGPLRDTEPAERPITVRHLLTMTAGTGLIMSGGPLAEAMDEAGVGPGPLSPAMPPEKYLDRLSALPLAAQPGTRWLYHTSSELLSVLLARAAGTPLRDLLSRHVTGPLGLADTGFWTGATDRMTTSYFPHDGALVRFDGPDGVFSRPPAFEGLGTGLVSSAPDYVAFLAALHEGRLLSDASRAAMTADQLTPAQRATADLLPDGQSFGYQVGVTVRATDPWTAPGGWTWSGGTGTTAYVNPALDLVSVLFTQRGLGAPDDGELFETFFRAVLADVTGSSGEPAPLGWQS